MPHTHTRYENLGSKELRKVVLDGRLPQIARSFDLQAQPAIMVAIFLQHLSSLCYIPMLNMHINFVKALN